MNYLIDSLLNQTDSYTTEIIFIVIVAILLLIAIIVLTIMKKLKDK